MYSKFADSLKKIFESTSLTWLTTHLRWHSIEKVLVDHGQSWSTITPSIDPKKLSITKKTVNEFHQSPKWIRCPRPKCNIIISIKVINNFKIQP